MKKNLITLSSALFIIAVVHAQNKTTVAQNANTTLSNLANPTKINVSLLPDGNGNHNIGNSTNAWRNLFIDSNIYVGGTRFISTPVNNSIAIGFNALKKIGKGNANTAVGSYALSANTTASYNTALGTFSLFNNTANGNTAVGYAALLNNSTGYSNVALGYAALQNNTTVSNAVAVGDSALFHQSSTNDDDQGSTAVGSKALYSNTKGIDNVGIGRQALYSNTSANWNTAIGSLALYYNTTGGYNTAVGHGALLNNTTGTENTAMGLQALVDNTTGASNTAIGEETLRFNTIGQSNTAAGWQALGSSTTASYNTANGYEAGDNVTDGWYNTFIGSDANCGSEGHLTNSTAIGNAATVTSSNHIVIGNSSITSIGGYENWTKLSDGRVKKNIKQNVPGLAFINKLQPITYNLDLDAADKIIARPQVKDKEGKIVQPSQTELDARKAKEQIVYTGFVAQDVETAAKSLNYDFSGVDKPDNANTLYGLRYSDFVVPLVKAVQELSKMNDAKDASIDSLKSEIENLKSEIENIKAMVVANQPTANAQLSALTSYGLVLQNSPNPFSNFTTINYSIPAKFSSAKIIITDKNGNALKQINLLNKKGSVNVDAATLSSGAYQYSLYVDGKLIASKQMEHIK